MAFQIQASDWLGFLENRLNASTRWIELLTGIGALFIAAVGSGFFQFQILVDPRFVTVFFGLTAPALSIAVDLIFRFVQRRRLLVLLMVAILSGSIQPQLVGARYLRIMER